MKKKNLKSIITCYAQLLLLMTCYVCLPYKSEAQTQWTDPHCRVYGTSDSRLFANVVEQGDSIKLEVTGVGFLQLDGISFNFLYDTSKYIVVDPLFLTRIPITEIQPPINAGMQIAPNLLSPATSPSFAKGLALHRLAGIGSMAYLYLETYQTSSNWDTYCKIPLGQVTKIFTVFFKKKTSGQPVSSSDFGIYTARLPKIEPFFSGGPISVGYRYGAGTGVSDGFGNFLDYFDENVFAYRWPSTVTSDSVTNILLTEATLNASFERSKFNPATDQVSYIHNEPMFASDPHFFPNHLLSWDTISRYGFIYSDVDANITFTPFVKQIQVDGVNYEITSTDIANGYFTANSKTFSIITHQNTSGDQTVVFQDGLTGLTLATNYYAWSFMYYAFETSDFFPAVGAKMPFATSGCEDRDAPTGSATQVLCDGAKVKDLVAFPDPDVPTDTIVWYQNGIKLSPSQLLVDGETYYARSVGGLNGLCISEDSLEVVVTLNPYSTTANILSHDTTVCYGQTTVDLTTLAVATGVTNPVYRWYSSLTDMTELDTTTVSPLDTATYYVSVSGDNYCEGDTTGTGRAAVTVHVTPLSIAATHIVAHDTTVCYGQTTVDLTTLVSSTGVTGAVNFKWYETVDGTTEMTSTTVSPMDTATYYVSVSGDNYCEGEANATGRAAVTVNVTPLAIAGNQIITHDTTVCVDNSTVDLSVLATTEGVINPVYKWYENLTTIVEMPSIIVTPTDTTTYYVAVSGDNYCEGNADATGRAAVTVNVKPLSIAADHLVVRDTAVCEGISVNLTDLATSTGIVNPVYTWYATAYDLTPLASTIVTPVTGVYHYYVAVSGDNYCEGEASPVGREEVTVTINAHPVVSVTPAGAYTVVGSQAIVVVTDDNTNVSMTARRVYVEDPSIASAVLIGDTIIVQGNAIGNTDIRYVSVNEHGCETVVLIPVQVGVGAPTGILTGKDIVKCNLPGGGDTTIVQIAYIMGGVSPWLVTIRDDQGTFSVDTLINSQNDLPVNIAVTIPENLINIPQYTTYTITNIMDAMNNSKQTHYGSVRIGTNPTPKITAISNKNQTVCADANTLPISFDGVATTYSYAVSENIGVMVFSHEGIPSFTAINETGSPITAKIAVTPEYWYNDLVCTGETDTAYITVLPKMVADFTTATTGLGKIQFTDASSTNAIDWAWNFGDGTTSTLQSPLHTFAVSGPYVISLTITSADGCTATISRTITVSATTDLAANFHVAVDEQCITGNLFRFIDQSSITMPNGHTISDYLWNFGDGSTADTANSVHEYAAAGHYLVTLTVTESPTGTQSSMTKTVKVLDVPVVYDTTAVLAVCEGAYLQVSMPSINWGGNTPVSGTWLLGGHIFNPLTTPVTVADNGKQLQYRVSSDCGEVTGNGVTISVNALPVADFSTAVTGIGTITFTDASTGAVTGWSWNFGDGTALSTAQNPVHTYTQSNTYNVTLTVTTANGCTSTITKTISANTTPALLADFTIDNEVQCKAGNNFIFTDMSTMTTPNHHIDSWSWDFGDGNSAMTRNATHTYTQAGTYNVTLLVTEMPGGTQSSMTKTVKVLDVPVVYDTTAVLAVCEGAYLQVSMPSIQWNGNTPVSGTWLLGGHIFNPLTTPVTVADNGKQLQYRVSSDCGEATGNGVTISVNALPVADFSTTVTGIGTITFTDASTGAVTGWSWNFGDGTALSTAQNPVHTYTQSNTYNVTLTVTTAGGCTSTITKPVTVSTMTDLSANFTIDDEVQCLTGNNFAFSDMSTITTPNHHIDSWSWDFGDGNSAMTRNATHTYTQAGTYSVTLLVTEMPGGTQSSMTKTVKVLDVPVVYDTTAVLAVCEGAYLQVSMPSIQWNGNTPVSGTWLLGGYIFDPTRMPVTALDNGKQLQYRVSSDCGETTGNGVTISVNALPVADFSTTVTGIGTVTFTDASTGAVTGWSWNFGDGTALSTAQNPVHTYAYSGTYNVTLTVRTAAGCTAVVTKIVSVSTTTDLTADFSIQEDVQCLTGNNFIFKDNSRITTSGHMISDWKWNFGDGNSAMTKDATHTYTQAGTYSVTLLVTEMPGGTQSSMTKTVKVLDVPVVYDTTAVLAVCEGEYLQVSMPSIQWNGNTPVSGTWLLGGHIFDPTRMPVTALDNGKRLQYQVSSDCGEATGNGVTISVNALPVADFSTTVTGIGTVTFTDASTGAVTGWSWNFGDGTALSTAQNPVHTYTQSNTYNVTLTVTTANGCTSTITKTISANTTPALLADFTIDNEVQCKAGNNFIFTDMSTMTTPNHHIDSWSWDFGDGNSAMTRNATHTYTQAGTYRVTLLVTEMPGGTQSSMTKTVKVLDVPVVYDTTTVLAVCEGAYLQVSMPSINWNGNTPVSGTWLLGGHIFNPLTTPVTVADNGKQLQYRVSSDCGEATGNGVTISVNALPVADFSTTVTGIGTITFTDASTGAVTGWSWNFGDGTALSTAQNPVHTYAQSNTYNVTLTVTTAGGCTSTITKPVTVSTTTDLSANFTIDDEVQCLTGNNFAFRDVTTMTTPNHHIDAWKWYFGDGDSAMTRNATHTYTQAGTYNVTLLVTEMPGGTQSSMTKTVKVLDVPVVYDTTTVLAVCAGAYLQVSMPSIQWNGNTPVSGTWLLGGHIFNPLTTPVTVADNGKQLQYRVSSDCGEATGNGVTISVNALPVADFSTAVTGMGIITFTDASTGAVTGWSWNFGDGTALSTAQNPVHTYTQSNTYNVTLTVTTAGGCTSTITKPVTVSTTTDLSANFTIDEELQCLTGNNFTFRDISTITTPNHHIDAWKWYFGDGDSAMTRNATHTYTQAGTYNVTLLVTEMPGGTQSSMTKTVKVFDVPVVYDTTTVLAVCAGEYLQVSMPSIQWNGNTPVSGTWLLGGHIFNPLTTPVTVADNGKLLQYKVHSDCGEATGNGVTISVNALPVADFSTTVTGMGTVTFTDASTGAVTGWSWNFGDGTAQSTAQNPVHTYTQFNTYNVTLTVTTASGCTSTITKPVTVSTTTDLSANFTINDEVQCLAGNNFIFTDMSTMTTPNHHIDAWKWYFGDGDSAMTRNATHTYTQAGTYTVTLLVTEMPGGTQSSMPKTVKVLDLPVITDMAYIPPVCEGEYLQLQMPVIEWNGNNPVEGTWILGGYIFNPFTRTMTAADNGKLLQYSVVTPCGISTSAGVPVTVNTVAALTVDPIVNVCENDATAQLGCTLGGSQQGGILYNITFDANALSAGFTNIIGDTLTTNTITIPLPASLSSGIYSGTLTVVMTNGCVNTTAYQFHIQVNEGVRIIKQPESVRLCQDAGFTLSVMATGKNLTYQWYRNDEPIQGAIASTYMVSMSDSTVDYGTYYVEVTGLCGTVTSNVAEVGDGGFTLMLKWTDVIFISNQNNYFVGYQWYKDGKPIGKDGNYQSYVEQGGLNGTYYVVVTYADGTKEASCPYTVMKSKMRSVLVYPNPTHSYSEVTIDMRGYPLDVVDNSKFEIFDAQGRYVIGKTLREQVEKIQLDVAKGTYMYRITTTEDEVIVGKILVH